MHVWTHLKPAAQRRTGIGLYPDGMVEHDDRVSALLKRLDELGIADNTIVGKTWKVHLDGYNFLPLFQGEAEKDPREEIFYFGQGAT